MFVKKNFVKLLVLLLVSVFCVSAFLIYQRPLIRYESLFLFLSGWGLILMATSRTSEGHVPLLVIASSCLLGVGFPPFTPISIFLGFVPILVLADKFRTLEVGRIRRLWWYYLTFLGFNLLSTFWIANTTFGGSLFAYLVNSLLMCIPFMVYETIRKYVSSGAEIILFVACWITFEYFHHNWSLSWIWLTLGNALSGWPAIVQWYEFTGVLGGSAWILIINFLLYRVVTSSRSLALWSGLGLTIVLPIGLSLILYSMPEVQSTGSVKVALVNPNIEPNYDFEELDANDRLKRMKFILGDNIDDSLDLVLLPEGYFVRPRLNSLPRYSFVQELYRLSERYGMSFIFGINGSQVFEGSTPPERPSIRTHVQEGDTIYWETYNNAIFVQAGAPLGIYNKKIFVPGAESFPFRDYLFFLEPIVRQSRGTWYGHGSYERDEIFVLDNEGAKVAPLICYEANYGGYVRKFVLRGADILSVITEDGWWNNTAGHKQFACINRLRAIELRKYIMRNANYGQNLIIDSKGRFVVGPNGYAEQACIIGEAEKNDKITIYARWGDWVGRLSAGMLLFLIIPGIANKIKMQNNL